MTLWSARLIGFGALSVFVLSGCQTSPNAAFPTAEVIAQSRAGSRPDLSTLTRGRKIYTTSCTECHVARPISELTAGQWTHIVEIMAPRANLTASDRAALEAYLLAARDTLPAG